MFSMIHIVRAVSIPTDITSPNILQIDGKVVELPAEVVSGFDKKARPFVSPGMATLASTSWLGFLNSSRLGHVTESYGYIWDFLLCLSAAGVLSRS